MYRFEGSGLAARVVIHHKDMVHLTLPFRQAIAYTSH